LAGNCLMRRVARAGALLMVALIGCVATTRHPSYAATDSSGPGGDQAVVDAAQAQESTDLAAIVQLAQEDLGASYAGAVIDNKSYRLNLYATAPIQPALLATMQRMAGPKFKVQAVTVKYSQADLKRLSDLVVGLMVTPVGSAINSTYVNTAGNKVHVVLADGAPTALLNNVLALGPTDAFEFGDDVRFFSNTAGRP
jgi:hypothetical protein